MQLLRRQILRHRFSASWLLAMALLVTALVPAGFMPIVRDGAITIQICPGQGVQTTRMTAHGMAGHHGDRDGHHDGREGRKADMPCAFGGLGLGYADAGATAPIAHPQFQPPERFTSPAVAPEERLAAPPPPSTGPPA